MENFSDSSVELIHGMVVLSGIPFDKNSSFLQGASMAPAAIRDALYSKSTNLCTENGVDLATEDLFYDAGDIELLNRESKIGCIEEYIADLLENGVRVLSLGGDHAITYPILRAYRRTNDSITVVQLDAHPDLYDEFGGNRYSHACPFARIMEEKLVKNLTQVGIRNMNEHQRGQAKKFGVDIIDMRKWQAGVRPILDGPVYLSVDMDVLDPAFAPGVSHPEPGGISTREVLQLIQGIEVPIIGADIVECNPKCDFSNMTAMVAAKCVKEIAGKMIQNSRI